ncbi:MAG: RecX family transcriptional regulator [Candidatus Zixiibacteriota bacterium]
MDDQPKIISVEEKPGGVRLTVSGRTEDIILPIDLVYRYNLKPGVTITPAQMDQLLAESGRFLCDRETARLLAVREHSSGEIVVKLKRKGFGEKLIAATVEKFRKRGLIDDPRLAMKLAQQALERKPAGRAFLVAVLRRKMIDRMLAELTVDTLLDEIDDIQSAIQALRQRWPVPEQIEVESVRDKAYSYLSRRGFGYETARAACSAVFGSPRKADDD